MDQSIRSESYPTVFSATKPARRGGKFHLARNVRHDYQSFQHRNELLLNKVSCCTMKTCDFSRSDDILTKTAVRAYSDDAVENWQVHDY